MVEIMYGEDYVWWRLCMAEIMVKIMDIMYGGDYVWWRLCMAKIMYSGVYEGRILCLMEMEIMYSGDLVW